MGDPLTRLGRSIDAEQGEILHRRPADTRARERFLASALLLAGPRRRPARILAAVAAVALVAGLLLVFFAVRRPLSFQVGAGEAAIAGIPGVWITTPLDRTVPVRFSDGTTVGVKPGAKRLRGATTGGMRRDWIRCPVGRKRPFLMGVCTYPPVDA